MVMSYGWNPYYKNTVRSAEVHILDSSRNLPASTLADPGDMAVAIKCMNEKERLPDEFYGQEMRLAICAHMRDEKDYEGVAQLREDIRRDCENAMSRLADFLEVPKDDWWGA